MAERVLTPSKVTAWLACPHYLALRRQLDDGEIAVGSTGFGSFARLVADKGVAHEQACLDQYRAEGRSVLEVPNRMRGEAFQAWMERVGDVVDGNEDVICQAPFVHDGMRGIADFLLRVEQDGRTTFEPVDAKLARTEAKPGHVLQLCFYAEAIAARTGVLPECVHIWLGSGEVETIRTLDVLPYWRRLRTAVDLALDAPPPPGPPERCGHCTFCEIAPYCEAGWRATDSLIYVTDIRSAERSHLVEAGIPTLAELAERPEQVPGIRPAKLKTLVSQAALQVEARADPPGSAPPFRLLEPDGESATVGHGLDLLPAPNEGDVFLDFEGHPFWRVDTGLFFLMGLIEVDGGEWTYRTFWAHDLAGEAEVTRLLVEHLEHRRQRYPAMHVYHYNHTERSSLERLTALHGVAEAELAELVATGAFVDLLAVVRGVVQIGTESYSLKDVERLTGFERSHDIDQGAGAVVAYEAFMADGRRDHLDQIARYNEDDVRATRAVRDWLVDHRGAGLAWRDAHLLPDPGIPELDAQVAELHAFDAGSVEHDLGDLLGYWRREWAAHLAPRAALAQADQEFTLAHPDALGGLELLDQVPRFGARGQRLKSDALQMSFPAQEADGFVKGPRPVIFGGADGSIGYADIDAIDLDAGRVDLIWSARNDEIGAVPSAIVINDWVAPWPKPTAVSNLAASVLHPDQKGAPNPASLALLRRDAPAFVPGGGPAGGRFSDDVAEMRSWATELDGTCVAVQGPPGTGKTYRGAHMARELILAGKRVGVTAFSHGAIANFVDELLTVFAAEGGVERLHAVRRVSGELPADRPGLSHTREKKDCVAADVNLVAGTTWTFAASELRDAPVDVLFVDEAGQLALVDALAASQSARNLLLLGDPSQLAHVDQAVHPGVSGRSALGHVLGDEVTMPADRGAFISETRRMHPDVCRFISETIYEGRLSSHADCARQATAFGTGLRWLPATHDGCTTSSAEEAEIVRAEAARLVGTDWTDHHGDVRPLRPEDLMVVAPFNDQVALIRACLDADDTTRGTPVGTVDRFQGRQAAVVFFTLTTSSGAHLTRGVDFLFSRHRLNVAVSRARCLAYLVCTDQLLNTRARTVEDMRLISTLCSFVEQAEVPVR